MPDESSSEQDSQSTQKAEQMALNYQVQTKKISQFENSKQSKTEIAPSLNQESKCTFQIDQPNKKKKLQIVAISDNHGQYKMMNKILSMQGDIFIHAGDFTYYCQDQHLLKFFDFLEKIKFKHKIVISGNHESALCKNMPTKRSKMTKDQIVQELTNRCKCIYLEHESVTIEGIKVFGSPYTPLFCMKPNGRAFQYKENQAASIWETIPDDTQLLITHGPPQGILDNGKQQKKAGCESLKKRVQQVQPRYHIFGHIHEGYGMQKIGNTTCLNVCNKPTRIIM